MTCPYCGHRDRTYQFVTDAHIRYTQHYINKLMDALNETVEEQELVIDMDELRDANIDVPKQNFYYAEESQQCRFQCEACGIHNDILGNYGYCSCCGTRNNLQLVRQIIADHQVKGMSLRDLVSVIESCGRDYVQQLVNNIHMTPRRRRHVKQIRFHDIERASNEIKTFFDIDLFHRINGDDKKFAKLMFLRRNVYEHNSGRADAKYIEKSGDTSVKIGQALRESKGSIERLVPITLKMMENLHAGFHSILPPVQKALEIMNPSSLATKK